MPNDSKVYTQLQIRAAQDLGSGSPAAVGRGAIRSGRQRDTRTLRHDPAFSGSAGKKEIIDPRSAPESEPIIRCE